MATLTRERQSLFPSPPKHPPGGTATEEENEGDVSFSSPYSLSKEDMNQLTEEFDHVDEELTTSGRTYEELVSASQQQQQSYSQSQQNSKMSEETEEESEDSSSLHRKKYGARKSMGFMLGRNSLSNWSTVGDGKGLLNDDHDDGIPNSVHMEHMNTGRKSNVSRLSLGCMSSEIPNTKSSHISQRLSAHVNNSRGSRGQHRSTNGKNVRLSSRPSHKMASIVGGRRSNSLNQSHISSSSSSGMDVTGESMLGESWSPIRTSLENSFAKSVVNEIKDHSDMGSLIGGKESGSLSPIAGRTSGTLSPKKLSQETISISVADGMSLSPNNATGMKNLIGAKSDGHSSKELSPVRRKSKPPTIRQSISPKKGPTKSKSPVRSPIRTISPKKGPTKLNSPIRSPIRPTSPKKSRTKSKSPVRSPVRSPLGDISPNRLPTRGNSPKRGTATSPKKNSGTAISEMTLAKKKLLSPNGTFSLLEAEGTGVGCPTATTSATKKSPGSNSSSNMSVSSGSEATASSVMSLMHRKSLETKEALLSLPLRREDLEYAKMKSSASANENHDSAEHSDVMIMQSPKKDEALSSLPTRREGLESSNTKANASVTQIHGPATTTSVQEENSDVMMMQSPEKVSMKGQVRAPAPTPNSQRRVIKRFRASIPTANYLAPEDLLEQPGERNPARKEILLEAPLEINRNQKDLMEESAEKNPNWKENSMEASVERNRNQNEEIMAKPVRSNRISDCAEESAVAGNDVSQLSKPIEVEDPAEPISLELLYENAFEFPSNSIPVPRTKTLRIFHDKAVSSGSPSHQYQLNRAGANLLSLQEVILPSIACEINSVLKKKQAKAQRNVKDGMPDSQGKEVVEAIETCRKVVAKCTDKAMSVAGEAWRKREKEREHLWFENLKKEEEQKRSNEIEAKKERKNARALSRQQRYEHQKREKQRSHPRNKELWQEVAKLMVDIQKLEKEERLWKEALVEVNLLDENHQPPEKMELDPIMEEDEDQLVNTVENANLESTATTLAEDVTMATERINWMLKSVSLAMDESDKLRKEAYEKYQYDGHKFYGYPQVDDSKALFMALSMESPLRE